MVKGSSKYKEDSIINQCTKDMQQALIQILEILPKSKAIEAVDSAPGNDDFRAKLTGFYRSKDEALINVVD